MLRKTVLSSFLAASLTIGIAQAAGYSEYAKERYPAPIQSLEKGGLMVVSQFEAAGGLHGWVLQEQRTSSHTLVFTTENGEVVIAGMVIDNAGQNLTAVYAQKYMPKDPPRAKADPTNQAEAYKAFTTESASVVLGSNKNAPEVTVVFDPNCGFCKAMHKILLPSIAAGDLRVRYVPVAILGGDSAQKAAAILAAKDPASAMDQAVSGALVATDDPPLQAKVVMNTALMSKYGYQGTPVVLYKSQVDGGKSPVYLVSEGVPTLSAFFASLSVSGQLDKLKGDPQLQRFIH